MVTPQPSESFRDLLLRFRGRSRLTQRQLAGRLGIHSRSVQQWEAGANYPSTERLEGLIRALLEAGGLTAGHEAAEAQALWAAVAREAPHAHAAFDPTWFVGVVAESPRSAGAPTVMSATSSAQPLERLNDRGAGERRQDWSDAPDTSGFVGRTNELVTLRRWILEEQCRLVAVLGMGGMGKTTLAARLAQEVATSFERVYWRSLRDAPSPSEWLAGAIGFLSDQQVLPPVSESERLTTLLQLLRERRCLLVLDNFETLFEPGHGEGHYRQGVAAYGRLLQAVGEAAHQSCLVVTSREAPEELALLAGDAVRSLPLAGLGVEEARVLLAQKQLAGTDEEWAELIAQFGGNGLALRLVGETIRELFDANVGTYLHEAGTTLFGGVQRLLADQLARTTALEADMLAVLAVEREPVSLHELVTAMGPHVERGVVLQTLEALRRRSLVDRAETRRPPAFTLQSVVLEYATDRLVEATVDEIERGQPRWLVKLPLIKAQAKDYVRRSQERLIGMPVLQTLEGQHGGRGTQECLLALLADWRDRPHDEQGSGPGNVVNLLRLLRGDLCATDLGGLELRHAYLAVPAQKASLIGSHLSDSVIAEPMSAVVSTALSPDARYVVAGTFEGAVRMWQIADRRLVFSLAPYGGPAWGVTVAPDGQFVATATGDGTVQLWDPATGASLRVLGGHTGGARGLALSADGQRLASCGVDATVRVWHTATGECLRVLSGHAGAVWGVAISADGERVASGGLDGTVRVWDVATGECLQLLSGHGSTVLCVALSGDAQRVAGGTTDGSTWVWDAGDGACLHVLAGHTAGTRSVALSGDGRLLASSGLDGTARVWDVMTGECQRTLLGHTGEVRGLSLSPDGRLLASGGLDGTVRVWDVPNGVCLHVLAGHGAAVWGVALSSDAHLLATVAVEGTLPVWDTTTGECLRVLTGNTPSLSVALSASGQRAASGGLDGKLRVWDTMTGECLRVLLGHTPSLFVALTADGSRVASGGADGTVVVWDTLSGQRLKILRHPAAVRTVSLSADGHRLASTMHDRAVRVWDTATGECLHVLAHPTATLTVRLNADGRRVVSGGADATVLVWDASTGECLRILRGHTGEVRDLALSLDGQRVASGSLDRTVRVWDTTSGECLHILAGHTSPVFGVALSGDGHVVASGGLDGTVHLWDGRSGGLLRSLRRVRLYEDLGITGLTGVTSAQRDALLALGAVEPSLDSTQYAI